MTGVKGIITSLNYPANYYHNLDYWIHVVGPYQSRIVFQFDSINIEPQADCLYDFVAVVEPKERENRTMTLCGYRGNHLEEWDCIVIITATIVNIIIYLLNKKKKNHNKQKSTTVLQCRILMTYYSYIFVTDLNEAFVHFHSDYSVSSSGFHLQWNTVDMSGCPSQTLSALEGEVVSPNYPNFILPNLNCVTMILAPGEG